MRKFDFFQKLMLVVVLSVFVAGSTIAQDLLADTLDRADWTVLSVDNEGEPMAGAIDGDSATRWATTWGDNSTPMPHYITIDMGAAYEISELVYLPRQDEWGPNGTIKNYTIFVGYSLGDFDQTASWFLPHKEQITVRGEIAWPEGTDTEGYKAMMSMPMERSLMGRYLRVYCDTAVTPEPECIIAEIWAKGSKLLDETNIISREHWTVAEVSDFHNPGWQALDGDWGTGWNTEWEPETPMPHDIVIDMAEEYDIDSLLYISRQDVWGPNGTIANLDVFVTNDTTDWGTAVLTDSILWYDIFETNNAMDSSQVHKNPLMVDLGGTQTGRFIKVVTSGWDLGGMQQAVVNELYAYGAATMANYEDVTDGVILNPGFEEGFEVAWAAGGWGSADFRDTTDAHTGSLAGMLAGGNGALSQSITIEENTVYRLSGFAKAINGSMRPGVSQWGGDIGSPVDVEDWTEFTLTFASSIGKTSADVYAWSPTTAVDWYGFVDDYKLEKIGPANFVIPEGMVSADQDAVVGDVVMVSAKGSYDEDGDELTYAWTGTAGLEFDDATAMDANITLGVDAADMVALAILVVNDGRHNSVADTVEITVTANLAPTADAGADQTVDAGATVVLDGSASSDPEEKTLAYVWTAPEGITLDDETAMSPTFTAPAEEGTLTFSLVVNDGVMDSEADEVVITVGPNALENNTLSNLEVYPNPSDGIFNIDVEETTTVKVTTMAGKVVASEVLEAGSNQLDLSAYSKGLYILSANGKSMLVQVK